MKYISKYSNGKYVTAAQYITELICENKAKQEKKDLYFKFWTSKEWSLYYRNQIATANKLVKQYNPQAIIRALKTTQATKIYSLRAPHLIPIIEQESVSIEKENQRLTKEYDRNNNKKFTTNYNNNKSIISKLKELE
jgi:hypothetical protein